MKVAAFAWGRKNGFGREKEGGITILLLRVHRSNKSHRTINYLVLQVLYFLYLVRKYVLYIYIYFRRVNFVYN